MSAIETSRTGRAVHARRRRSEWQSLLTLPVCAARCSRLDDDSVLHRIAWNPELEASSRKATGVLTVIGDGSP